MITLSTRFKVQPLYTWSLSQQDCHPKSWSDVLRYKNHAIELNYEDTSRGIYYIVSWFALEIKLSEGWFERVRAEGHCWTSIKMSPHTECQNYANIPQSSSLRQTFTHRCNFQQVYWGKGRPAIYACSWLSDCTLHNHCFSYFIFCILTFAFYILAIYACSGSGSLSCYQIALKYAKLLYISQRRFFFASHSFIVNFLFSTLLWFVQNCIVLMFCIATDNHKEP